MAVTTGAKPANKMLARYFPGIKTLNKARQITYSAGIPIFVGPFYSLLTSLDTPANIATFVLPFAGQVISWQMVTRAVATSGGTADADIDLLLEDVPITGALAQALTQADFDTIGKRKAGGTITALNSFAAGATLKVTCTESTTNFTAGAIDIYLYCIATDLTGAMQTSLLMAPS